MKISLRRRHAKKGKDCASSNKIDYVDIFSEILNLNGNFAEWEDFVSWTLSIGEVATGRVCA